MGGEAAGVLTLSVAERLLILPVAGAKHHHLHVQAHNLLKGVCHQGEALVANQTGHAGDDGHIRILLKANGLLQGLLTLVLALDQGAGGKVGGKARVGGWIVEVHIDAV